MPLRQARVPNGGVLQRDSALRAEREQSILRVVLVSLVYIYVVWSVLKDGYFGREDAEFVAVGACFVALGFGILAAVVISKNSSLLRRVLGMIADNGATTYCLIQMDEGGAFVLGVYLFVAFGNGFRFGRAHLHASQALSILGFGLVLVFSPFWSKHTVVGMGFMTCLLILPFYVAVLAQRITEAKHRADEANQAKGRFLANMSHEMRTPLNGVIAMADVLRETDLSESQREIVETMTTSAHLLLAQIEDVLDMAKIEAGRVPIETRPFDLERLVASTVKVMLPQARYKGLLMSTQIDLQSSAWWNGDSPHIRQVLLNLVSNAVKFTEHGNVTVRVQLLPQQYDRSAIRFEVSDTGIGIPTDKIDQIFDPFTQADDSITRVYGGTGLGTTIARHLVTAMGGTIGVTSTQGVGSTFWFELPLTKAEPQGVDLTRDGELLQAGSPTTPGTHDRLAPKVRGARILVAEDNTTNQNVARLILESGGHVVTIVNNGEDALDALERDTFDLALFDLSMPIVSGIEALKLYRFSTPSPIPVLILSANVTTEAMVDCERAGAAEFISKPLRASLLLDAIDRHVASGTTAKAESAAPLPIGVPPPQLSLVDPQYLDPAVLAGLDQLSADATFVDRLILGFKSDASRLVQEIAQALEAHRYESAKDSAHALKGGAASVGAVQLANLASRIDKATHDVLRTRSSQFLDELQRTARSTCGALDKHLAQRGTQRSYQRN